MRNIPRQDASLKMKDRHDKIGVKHLSNMVLHYKETHLIQLLAYVVESIKPASPSDRVLEVYFGAFRGLEGFETGLENRSATSCQLVRLFPTSILVTRFIRWGEEANALS